MAETLQTTCCIAGGGPAGMMLGYLLARAGVEVVVLEKHTDFLRDFRGDTVHPSTLEVMDELGLLEEFLKRPHQEVDKLRGWIGNYEVVVADFTHLPTRCKFIALMPQWDFLNFLSEHARQFPAFHLRMQTEVTQVIEENGRIVGLRASTPQGPLEIRADLVVGADGRSSVVRKQAGLQVQNLGAPIDVLWMRLSRRASDPTQTFGRFDRGKILVMLNRESYWQLGYVIPKGGIEVVRQEGLPALREALVSLAPFFRDRVEELKSWEDVKLLTVTVDRLRTWYKPGLLCIGDAAHAMSPVGGVGINLAIQDAVAAAAILAHPLKQGAVSLHDLKKVQSRRLFPTRVIQGLQLFAHKHVIGAAMKAPAITSLPWLLRVTQKWPVLQRIPARLLGLGVRPEHVEPLRSL